VIHGEQPRLLEFDGIDIETPLEGNLLVCRNLDVPGVIGKIGTILGEHGVNIANFALGREREPPSKSRCRRKAVPAPETFRHRSNCSRRCGASSAPSPTASRRDETPLSAWLRRRTDLANRL
jgi:hypothetical protein